MKLLSVYVENFGKLHRYRLEPDSGLTTLLEPNGWGKTTLAAFLKAMLYDLPKSSRRNLDENERVKYTPWQGGAYGGSLTFSCRKGVFRAERFFDPDSFALYDEATGKPSDAFSERLGEELFGIDADGFERSVFFSFRSLAASAKNDTVSAKLTGVADDAHDMARFDIAMKALDERRKEYKKTGNRGRIGELEEQLRTIGQNIRDARSASAERDGAEQELAGLRAKIGQAEQEERLLRSAVERVRDKRKEVSDLEQEDRDLLARSGGSLPDDEALKEQWDISTRLQTRNADLRRAELSPQEKADLDRLSAVFRDGVPDAGVLAGKQRELSETETLRGRILALREVGTTIPEAYRKYGIPDGSRFAGAEAALADATGSGTSGKAGRFPRIAAPVFLLAGVLLAAVGALLPNSAVAVSGGVLTVIGLLLLLRMLFRGKKSLPRGPEHPSVVALLEQYGIPHADGDLRLALERLRHESDAARAALEREAEIGRKQEELRQSEAALRAFLRQYGIGDGGIADGLNRLEGQRNEYLRLLERRTDVERETAAIREELRGLQSGLEGFLSRYGTDPSRDSAQRLRDLEQRVQKHRSLLDRIAGTRNALDGAIRDPGTDPAGSDPQRRLAELTDDLALLRGKTEQTVGRLTNLNRIAEQLPELEEQRERLTEESGTLQANLEVLQNTAAFLRKAKEALTARYLDGMREGFGRYLARMAGENPPAADMDADLDVTVEEYGKRQKPESYSRGWQDLMRFCARLALTDALFRDGEPPFLLLDDPFSGLDDAHLAAALDLLRSVSSKKQLLYFTCASPRSATIGTAP